MAYVSDKRRTVILTLTNNCNLNCSYCYEKHNTAVFEFENIINIINNEFHNNPESDEIEFDFFGGEPFLEFNTIRKVVEYVQSKSWPKPYCFFATTNGSLVHGEIQNWLRNQSNFYCGLSFDGTPDMQDINRSNSSKLIDLEFFVNQYPNQDVKMTISKNTIKSLYDGIVYLEGLGFHVSCNLAYGIDWSDNSNAIILEQQLSKLIERYLENPELAPSRILSNNIDRIATRINKSYVYCGAGTAMIAYDVDGNKYPCQLFMPLACGNEKAQNSKNIKFHHGEIPEQLVETKCNNCVVKNVCPTCYGANYIEFNDIYHHSESYCKLTKIIMRAKSHFRARQWELGLVNLSENDELIMLKSISMIQRQLQL